MVTFLVALRSPGFNSRWCIATFLPLNLCQTQIKQYINQKSTPTYGPDIRRVKSFQSAIGVMVRIFAFQATGRGSIPRWCRLLLPSPLVRSLPLWALLSLMRSLPSLALSLVRSLPSWELSLMRSLPSWALLSLMRSLPSLALLSLVSRPVPWDLMCEGERHLLHLVSLTQLNEWSVFLENSIISSRGTLLTAACSSCRRASNS